MTNSVLDVKPFSAEELRTILNQPPRTTIQWATYEFGGVGLSALMCDRMTEEQIIAMKTKQKVDYPADEPLETAALRKMYSDAYKDNMPDGKFVIPQDNLFAALRDAGEVVQYGSAKNETG